MEILGQKIRSGKRNHLEMDVGSLYTRTKIEVPIIVEKARKMGPTLLITGGIHGDEVTGIEIVRRLLYSKQIKPQAGAVICVPIVNVMAFLNMDRKFSDGRDLNRAFPGNIRGSLASQVAYSITTKILPHADYVIDLHAGAEERFNYPQIRYDLTHPDNIELAKAFNAPFTLLQNKAPRGSMRRVLNASETPTVIFEGGKSKTVKNEVIETGVAGVLRVMNHLGILTRTEKKKALKTKFLHENRWIRARHSGMFQPAIENGSFVKKGQLLAFYKRSVCPIPKTRKITYGWMGLLC